MQGTTGIKKKPTRGRPTEASRGQEKPTSRNGNLGGSPWVATPRPHYCQKRPDRKKLAVTKTPPNCGKQKSCDQKHRMEDVTFLFNTKKLEFTKFLAPIGWSLQPKEGNASIRHKSSEQIFFVAK